MYPGSFGIFSFLRKIKGTYLVEGSRRRVRRGEERRKEDGDGRGGRSGRLGGEEEEIEGEEGHTIL
jgi:hypothetical protein